MKNTNLKNTLPKTFFFLVIVGILIYQFIQISKLKENVATLTSGLASTTVLLSLNTEKLSKNFTDLDKKTAGLSNTLSSAQQNIDAVKNQVGGVEQTLGSVSGAVGTLQKLSTIDGELLKKYSKIYFMNENYKPAHITEIPNEYLYSSLRGEQFLTEAYLHLKNLLDAAKADGIKLYVKSAYRSFDNQKATKSSYTVVYGAGTANSFSADQGYSEHQIGTATDFITSGLNGQLTGFDNTEAYKWMTNNAYRFGFTLSYPKNNSYYVYEPWHWRFVGVKLSTYLHDNKKNFYDLEQREIDKYLVDIFD